MKNPSPKPTFYLMHMGVVMIQGTKDCVECNKISHPLNFQKSLKKF